MRRSKNIQSEHMICFTLLFYLSISKSNDFNGDESKEDLEFIARRISQEGARNSIITGFSNKLFRHENNRAQQKMKRELSLPKNLNEYTHEELVQLIKYYQLKEKEIKDSIKSRSSRLRFLKEYKIVRDEGLAGALILNGYFGKEGKYLNPMSYAMIHRRHAD